MIVETAKLIGGNGSKLYTSEQQYYQFYLLVSFLLYFHISLLNNFQSLRWTMLRRNSYSPPPCVIHINLNANSVLEAERKKETIFKNVTKLQQVYAW